MSNIEDWARSCLSKKRYSHGLAEKLVQQKLQEGIILYKYRCPDCGYIHLTKKKYYDNRYMVLRIV